MRKEVWKNGSVPVLGITGGVGAGKSTVLEYLAGKYGAVIIECDRVAEELQQPGEACYAPMRELFGDDCLLSDGTFDRKKVAARVFSDPPLRGQLNRIVHPAVKHRVKQLIGIESFDNGADSNAAGSNVADGAAVSGTAVCSSAASNRVVQPPLYVIEAALLIDDHYDEICDEIWYVYAAESVRRERLKKSRGYSDERVDRMFRSQRQDESFRENTDLTIDNSSDCVENTFKELDAGLSERGFL